MSSTICRSKAAWGGDSFDGKDGPLKLFYSPDYAAAPAEFDTTRKAAWIARSLAADPIAGVETCPPGSERLAQILPFVHDGRYLDAVCTGEPMWLAQSSGFHWGRGTWEAVCASTAGVLEAALEAAHSGGVSGSLSSGMHHARFDRGCGFCTFNGLAVAARAVLDVNQAHVLILDLDAHCGGGTDSLVRGWERLIHLDIAVSAFDRYTPAGRSTLDLVSRPAVYLRTLQRRLARLDDVDIGLVLYNAGVDPHEDCDIGGLTGITGTMLAERDAMVFDWARRRHAGVAFALAGGYEGGRLSRADLVGLHRATIAQAARIGL